MPCCPTPRPREWPAYQPGQGPGWGPRGRGRRPVQPPPGTSAAASAGGRRHAPAHHRPQRLRQEFSVPDPRRSLAHLRRRAVQAPAPAHVLHPSEVRGGVPPLRPYPFTRGTCHPGAAERGASGELSEVVPPESEGPWCLHLPSGRGLLTWQLGSRGVCARAGGGCEASVHVCCTVWGCGGAHCEHACRGACEPCPGRLATGVGPAPSSQGR